MLPKLGVAVMMKNESRVIERCLSSILDVADMVIMTDTGSTDDTVAKAGLYLQNRGVRYKIYLEEFKDFGHNRNLLLEKCKLEKDIDYILMIDADDYLRYELSFEPRKFKEQLYGDFCDIKHSYGFHFHHFPKLTKNALDFRYVGLTHEYLDTKNYKGYLNPYIYIEQLHDGQRRSSGQKFQKDLELLEREPNKNSRIIFYLAETNRSLGNTQRAIEYYHQRTQMGDWDEEIFYSYYQMGKLHEKIGSDELMVTTNYWKAYEKCPFRIESLVNLYLYWKKLGYKHLPEVLIDKISKTPKPLTGLFIEEDKYCFLP